MINQARNYILNAAASERPALGEYGEQYVPPEFIALPYPRHLQAIRSLLIGSSGDPLYQNYMLAQLMAVMHANQYSAQYATGLDPRFTYRPFRANFFDDQPFGTTVYAVDGKGMSLEAAGDPVADDGVGRAWFSFQVSTGVGPQLLIQPYGDHVQAIDVTVSDQLTQLVPLHNGVSVRVYIPIGSWVAGASWKVTCSARPKNELSTLLRGLRALGPGTIEPLFTGVPVSFPNLWRYGTSAVDQLAGVLGAFVAQAEEIHSHVG